MLKTIKNGNISTFFITLINGDKLLTLWRVVLDLKVNVQQVISDGERRKGGDEVSKYIC